MQKKNGHSFYMMVSKATYTGKDNEYFLDAYMISPFYKLAPVSVFYKKEEGRASLTVPYQTSPLNENNPEIRISGDKQRIFVPVMNQMNEAATGKIDVYIYDGNNYVFDKNAK